MLTGALAVVAARIVFVAALVAASVEDVRFRRLPNALTVGGLVAALAWHGLAPGGGGLFARGDPGALGLAAALWGAGAVFALFFLLYVLRITGAGDVKLMAALGAVFTVGEVGRLIVFVFLAGGLLSVARLINRRRRAVVFANLWMMFYSGASLPRREAASGFDPASDSADRLPFGLAISLGAAAHAAAIWFGVFG